MSLVDSGPLHRKRFHATPEPHKPSAGPTVQPRLLSHLVEVCDIWERQPPMRPTVSLRRWLGGRPPVRALVVGSVYMIAACMKKQHQALLSAVAQPVHSAAHASLQLVPCMHLMHTNTCPATRVMAAQLLEWVLTETGCTLKRRSTCGPHSSGGTRRRGPHTSTALLRKQARQLARLARRPQPQPQTAQPGKPPDRSGVQPQDPGIGICTHECNDMDKLMPALGWRGVPGALGSVGVPPRSNRWRPAVMS